jgi:cytochrome c-type biogenesis protein CcmF
LVNWESSSASLAPFKIYVNPLVNWLWIGALVFLIGILIAAWPERETEAIPARVRRAAHQPSSAD